MLLLSIFLVKTLHLLLNFVREVIVLVDVDFRALMLMLLVLFGLLDSRQLGFLLFLLFVIVNYLHHLV